MHAFMDLGSSAIADLCHVVSYADLVIVGALRFVKSAGEDIYERAVGIEPALKDLYEASKAWLERDDH